MKVVAINSSPKAENGHTAQILNPFLDGMRDAGADVELFYTKQLKIEPCCGLFNCFMVTPGSCTQMDDMQTLIPKLRDADVWVLATPVHLDGVSGPMKNFIDRTHGYYAVPPMLGGLKAALLSVAADEGCWGPHEVILSSWLRVYGAQLLPPVRVLAREKGDAMSAPRALRALDEWAGSLLALI